MNSVTTWNLEAPANFQGFREDVPLESYLRHLPHWRQTGATYFVTFRLADSIPNAKLNELNQRRADWLRANPPPHDTETLEQLARMMSERVEHWLDQGYGSCVLKHQTYSQLVSNSLQHFHLERYELGASVVMPNHVHCIVRPLPECRYALEDITKSWKSYSAYRINCAQVRTGALWQPESYDRIIRDEEHLWRCLQYIGRNPTKAGLDPLACRLWVNPKWEKVGWVFDPPYEKK